MAKQEIQLSDGKAQVLREYDVVADFWDGPHFRKAGKETLRKSVEEAKYLVPHILRLKGADPVAVTDPEPKADTTKPQKSKR